MDWLFNPASRANPKTEFISRNTIVKNFQEKYPNAAIGYWMRPDEPYLCDIIYKNENDIRTYVYANPYTGEIQGETAITFQRFFRDLHYYLFIPFEQIGNYIVLFFGFLLLISLITALFFYKKWWRKLFELKLNKGPLVFFRSTHRLIGLWSVPFSLLFSITGIWYFIERANIAGVGEEVNPSPPLVDNIVTKTNSTNLSYSVDYDKAVDIAKSNIPGIEVGDILPPQSPSSNIYLTGKSDMPLVRQRANRLYINPYTYEVIKVQKAEEMDTVMWLNDIADPLHFGYWGGLITKIIWFVLGMGISFLILSGIWITLKRKAAKSKKDVVMGWWGYLNWGIFLLIMSGMYAMLIEQYKASPNSILIISVGWIIFLALTYYIFVFRMNRAVTK
ncbi:PepSY domain-containing protein [Christiangramia sp.]|uniref:PepSY-associated TM helix domain-containing protein n=1 Tax=Christiangramia sp. TaxID=1931228 RepID=UPI002632D253|nr:PepSY domain-containing protein [Christiangramia sp.]